MARAAYLPVRCGQCRRLNLQSVRPGEAPCCVACGAVGTVLPGPTYLESDVASFNRIEAALRPLDISRNDGEAVVRELAGDSTFDAPESVLLRVVDVLPTLDFLIPPLRSKGVLLSERRELARIAGMLLTIVRARLRELEGGGAPPAARPLRALDGATTKQA